MRQAEGGRKTFGVFRVKNHDFTPNNHIFIAEEGAKIFGVFRVKITILRQKIIFFPIIGSAPDTEMLVLIHCLYITSRTRVHV
jgi:hypothetical protein